MHVCSGCCGCRQSIEQEAKCIGIVVVRRGGLRLRELFLTEEGEESDADSKLEEEADPEPWLCEPF